MNPFIIKESLRLAVAEYISANVRTEYDPVADMYYAYIWREGIVKGAVTKGKAEWEKVVKTFEAYCLDMRETIKKGFDSDAHLTFMVLNDLNQKATLLTITDGITHYDFMTEVLQNE